MSFRWFGSAIKKAELIATVQLRLRLSVPAHDFSWGRRRIAISLNDCNHLRRFKFALFDQGRVSTVGKAVVLTDGEAGTVDEVRGLQISIRGHYGKWPISTIKFAEGH
jgi:hypothetical protein